MKRVLVVGAAGFIGRRIVAALAGSEWAEPIAGIHRRPVPEATNLRQRRIEGTDVASMAVALEGVDAVVNCLTGSPQSIRSGADALFASAARIQPVPLIVHLSSMAVYGSVSGDVNEDAPLAGDLGGYSHAKLCAEHIAADYPRVIVLRPGCVYGPQSEQWSGRVARWLLSGRIGDLGAEGDGWCNLVHVDDVVQAVLQCLRRDEIAGRAFNLAMPDPPTWNEYFVRYARALGAIPVRRIARRRLLFEAKALATPLKLLEMASGFAGLRGVVPPPIPPSLLSLMRHEIRLIPVRAQRTLGWTSRPLDEGLAQTAEWYLRSMGRAGLSAVGDASRQR